MPIQSSSLMPIPDFDAYVMQSFPDIQWREPIEVSGRTIEGLGCRLCIARLGLKADKPEGLVFDTLDDFLDHLKATHGHTD